MYLSPTFIFRYVRPKMIVHAFVIDLGQPDCWYPRKKKKKKKIYVQSQWRILLLWYLENWSSCHRTFYRAIIVHVIKVYLKCMRMILQQIICIIPPKLYIDFKDLQSSLASLQHGDYNLNDSPQFFFHAPFCWMRIQRAQRASKHGWVSKAWSEATVFL